MKNRAFDEPARRSKPPERWRGLRRRAWCSSAVLAGLLLVSRLSSAEEAAPAPRDEAGARGSRDPGVISTEQVRVTLRADNLEATLERAEPSAVTAPTGFVWGEGRGWQRVCAAPCDVHVSTSDDFRVAGDGIRPSRAFRLMPGAPYELAAKTGSRRAYLGSAVLLPVAVVAGALAGANYLMTHQKLPSEQHANGDVVTYTLIGVGVVALAVAIPLLLTSETRVHTKNGEELAKRRAWRVASIAARGVQW